MQIENEIKILDIDIEQVKKKLLELGFMPAGEFSYQRYIYDVIPSKSSAWLRLRTDGKKTTLTYKESTADTIEGMKEVEIVVDDIDKTNELLKVAGHEPLSYQENKRINFEGMDCVVSIDTWPLIPTYLEIEGKDAQGVKKCMEAIHDVASGKITSLPTEAVYKQYGIDISSMKELKFQQ